jgi:crotonobetaine/carnitine-CoA ligase
VKRQLTLPVMLQRQAEMFGDAPFLSIGQARWSHAEPARAAARLSCALAGAGIARGDRVAMMCGNRVEFIETFLGCGWLGAAAVPINSASMGPQIGYFLADSQARLLVIEAQFVARLAMADLSRTSLRAIWVVGADGAGGPPPADIEGVRVASYDPARFAPQGTPRPEAVQPGEALAILYTSGTSGPAKGVICPHAQYCWWGRNSAEVLGVGSADVLCTTLPLFHINALNTFGQAALTGCQVVYEPRFSASGFWTQMNACGATVVYLLGAMVPILLSQPAGAEERDHRVRIGLGPGVPTAAAATFLARTGVPLLEGYGSTETNFVIATAPDSPRKGVMGWLRPASTLGWRTRTTPSCLRARPANCSCVRTNLMPSPAATSACRRRRWRRGATSGSTPVTGSCAMPTALSVSSTGSRTRFAGAARTSPPSRSNRSCSAILPLQRRRFIPSLRTCGGRRDGGTVREEGRTHRS